MFKFLSKLLPLTFVVLLIACPNEINPPEILPPGVRIKQSNGLAAASEAGTRSVASFQNQIRVEWSPVSTLDNIIEEYIVFRSVSRDSQFFPVGNRIVTISETDSFWVDQNVSEDSTYFYYVIARDSRDNFSDTTDYFHEPGYLASIRLGTKVLTFIKPPTDTATTKPTFRWCATAIPVSYFVKLATPTQQVIWVAQKQSGTFDANCDDPQQHEYLTFHNVSYSANDSLLVKTVGNVTIHFINPAFFNGGRLKKDNYLWRVDCDFGDAESRSGWVPFTVTND